MNVTDALACLGSSRVIWIDDCFSESPEEFATLLINGLEITKACDFKELKDAVALYEFNPEAAETQLRQILIDLPHERRAEMQTTFFSNEEQDERFSTSELSAGSREKVCKALGIAPDDRWNFEEAESKLKEICASDDSALSYVVDLNQAGGSKTRGLDILKNLGSYKSKGTAFILTHEATIAREAEIEAELRENLKSEGFGIPLCVVAKERLQVDEGSDPAIEEALRVAVKRAGLRRSMHDVLMHAKDQLQRAFDDAAQTLLSVTPEHLEAHVIERGRKEGVSELHVVERALTAFAGRQVRRFFGTDASVRKSTQRLRLLRAIPLQADAIGPDSPLAVFRRAEVWEDDALINGAYTPLACGDVFEIDPDEAATRTIKKRFILLGQPCDISLRSNGKRDTSTAYLIPLKPRGPAEGEKPLENRMKEPPLPFALEGVQWLCDFREASPVNLSILDLATFRTDGRVRVDVGHSPSSELLPGQQQAYDSRVAEAGNAISAADQITAQQIASSLRLTFTDSGPYRHISTAKFEPKRGRQSNGLSAAPIRVTWRLRRCGRVRMPYAAAVLDQYVNVISRRAFDLDYMNPGFGET